MEIIYKNLQENEISRELFRHFVRHQTVVKCRRKENGKWIIKDDPFIDDWSEADYKFLVSCLRNTAATGGLVYAAFCEGVLKGFVSVEPKLFGGNHRYFEQECDNLHDGDRFCFKLDNGELVEQVNDALYVKRLKIML